jgi:pimeloyl-ACP methyl ester carboxylesterase
MHMRERWTPSGVRLRKRRQHPGDLDWLLLPGGPGIGSESLHELADLLDVPGRVWMVDLPGDGSNTAAPGAPADPFSVWPSALLEAAGAVSRPVFVGHSTGGEYILSVPELEDVLVGMVLLSTAPSAAWMPDFEAMTRAHPLPAVDAAMAVYGADPTDAHLRDLAVASAPWNFRSDKLDEGADLLAGMPYNRLAVDWSAENFDSTYAARWWPRSLPTLIVSGSDDRIVNQSYWDDHRFRGEHMTRASIDGGAHFAWIEEPEQVRTAFTDFARGLTVDSEI